MKRTIVTWIAAAAVGLLFAVAGARATGGEPRFQVAQSGQGAFVVLDQETGAWEHVATRPSAQGMLTVMRGGFGEDFVQSREVSIRR